MKIKLKYIKPEGISLSERIPANCWDLDSETVKFIGDIQITCQIQKINKYIKAAVNVSARQKIICSRCLEEAVKAAEWEFAFYYAFSEIGEELALDSDIREEVLLNYPMKSLCKDDCRGLCPYCGVNLNKEECRCKNKIFKSNRDATKEEEKKWRILKENILMPGRLNAERMIN